MGERDFVICDLGRDIRFLFPGLILHTFQCDEYENQVCKLVSLLVFRYKQSLYVCPHVDPFGYHTFHSYLIKGDLCDNSLKILIAVTVLINIYLAWRSKSILSDRVAKREMKYEKKTRDKKTVKNSILY